MGSVSGLVSQSLRSTRQSETQSLAPCKMLSDGLRRVQFDSDRASGKSAARPGWCRARRSPRRASTCNNIGSPATTVFSATVELLLTACVLYAPSPSSSLQSPAQASRLSIGRHSDLDGRAIACSALQKTDAPVHLLTGSRPWTRSIHRERRT